MNLLYIYLSYFTSPRLFHCWGASSFSAAWTTFKYRLFQDCSTLSWMLVRWFFFLFHVIAQPGCDVPRTAHMFPICKQNTMLQTQSQLKCAVTVIWERLSSNYRSNRSACHQGDIKRIWCWHCLLSICTSVTMCFYLYSSVWKTKKQLLNSGGDLFS